MSRYQVRFNLDRYMPYWDVVDIVTGALVGWAYEFVEADVMAYSMNCEVN